MSGQVTFLLAVLALSLVIFLVQALVFRRSDRGLRPIIRRAKRGIKELARQRCPNAKVFTFGATHLDPRLLAIWVTTKTDKERDDLANDVDLHEHLRAVLLQAGYPPEAVPHIGFAFESQQTVDRDFAGNWYHRIK